MTRVAIVGGGAAGVLTLVHLARRWPQAQRIDVVLYDGSGRVGHGAAYSTSDPGHLLNVPAARMSALDDDDDHFLRWLRRHDPGAGGTDFRSRAEYGSYLAQCLAKNARRVRLVVRHAQVGDLARSGDRWFVTHSRGTDMVDAVILALGHAPPAPLPAVCRPGAGYVADPWARGALDDLLRSTRVGDTVLTVGTGLTAVDVALSLVPVGRRVVAVSRNGLLPAAHAPTPSTPVPLEVDALPPTLTVGQLEEVVRNHVHRVTGNGGDWRDAVDGLRPVTGALWQRLPTAERAELLTGPARRWEVVRHRMAPAVAARIDGYRRDGSFTVVSGEVLAALCSSGHSRVTVRSATGDVRRFDVAAVVNCTGPTCDITHYPGGLGGRLLSRGLVRADLLRLGVETTGDGLVLDADGTADARFAAVGALRRGSLYESTAVPELREQAATVATVLGRELAASTVAV